MRIAAVGPAPSPYVRGGYERVWTGLVNHLNEQTDHVAELIKLPFPETDLVEVVDGYRRFSELDLSGFDLVLTGKYPGWMVRHPNLVVYMSHPLRGLYETYPADFPLACDDPLAERARRAIEIIPSTAEPWQVLDTFDDVLDRLGPEHGDLAYPGPLARTIVRTLDRMALHPSRTRRHLAISRTVASRPGYFPADVTVDVALHPTSLELRTSSEHDHLFTCCRLDGPKRVDLLIEAMAHVRAEIPLLIAGSGPEATRLKEMAAPDPRIRLLGFVDDDEMARLYAGAVAVPFIPEDEDFGLVAIEALGSAAPVVTTIDAGGPTEVVRHLVNGAVVDPTPRAIGSALSALATRPDWAAELGRQGRADVAGITWSALASRLIAPSRRHRPPLGPRSGKPRVAVLSTYQIAGSTGGGALRCRHLYGSLSADFDIEAVSLAPCDAPRATAAVAPGFVEHVVPTSRQHLDAEASVSGLAGLPLGDLLGGRYIGLTPDFVTTSRTALNGADAVILAHPYLAPVLDAIGPRGRVVYDAHNSEITLKSAVIGRTIISEHLVSLVGEVERTAIAASDLVVVCAENDRIELERHYGDLGRVHMAPNGVSLDETAFVPLSVRSRRRQRWLSALSARLPSPRPTSVAMFMGSWHIPNLEAAELIHSAAALSPSVLFVMVGGHTSYFSATQRELPANVMALGVVDEALKRLLLGLADVALNPMLTGSGTNLKLVEYLAAGVPTISTAVGARGLTTSAPPLRLVAPEADALAAAIEELVADSGDLDAMARAGRSLVEDHYDWRTIGARFLTELNAVLGAPR